MIQRITTPPFRRSPLGLFSSVCYNLQIYLITSTLLLLRAPPELTSEYIGDLWRQFHVMFAVQLTTKPKHIHDNDAGDSAIVLRLKGYELRWNNGLSMCHDDGE